MKIVLEIELLSPGKWGLDMAHQVGPAYVGLTYGENLTEEQAERKIADAVQAIMHQLSGGDEEPEPDTEAHLGDWTEGDGTPDHRRPA